MKLNKEDLNYAVANLDRARGKVSEEDRRLLTLAAVAKGIAYALPLPGQKVDSIRQYYVTNCEALVIMAVSDINEVRVLNVKQTMEFVFQVFRARYSVAYDPKSVELHKLVDTLVSNDQGKSMAPEWAGIFERLSADGGVAHDYDYVATRICGLLADSVMERNDE